MNFKSAMALFCMFLLSIAYTIPSTFYPGLAVSKGISLKIIGMFSIFDALASLLSSILVAKYIGKIGRKAVIVIGMSLVSLNILLIGIFINTDYYLGIAIIALMRFSYGSSSGFLMVGCPSILISENPGQTDKFMSYYSAVIGLGCLIGPFLSSSFYLINLKYCIYGFFGFLFLVTIICLLTLKNFSVIEDNHTKLPFRTVVQKPKLFINFCAQSFFLFSFSYLTTIVELHLESFGLATYMVGIFCGLCYLFYFITSIFQNQLLKVLPHKQMIIIGIFGLALSFWLTGPVIQVFDSNLIMVIFGIAGIGLFSALLYSNLKIVPITGLILTEATQYYGLENNDALVNSVTGFTSFFDNLGDFLGAFLAGTLSDWIGFSNGCTVVGLIIFTFAVIYILIGFYFNCNNRRKENVKSQDFDNKKTKVTDMDDWESNEKINISNMNLNQSSYMKF